MSAGGLLVLAVGPAVFWLACVYVQQYYRPIPVREVVIGFALGMVSTIPAFLLEAMTGAGGGRELTFGTALLIGIIEESCKFGFVYMRARTSPYVTEALGGMVLSSAVALGFASGENIEYALAYGPAVAVLRAFTGTLGHVAFSGAFGFFIGRANDPRIDHRRGGAVLIPAGLAVAALGHGVYDAAVSTSGVLLIPAFAACAAFFVYTFRRSQRRSPYRRMTAPPAHRCVSCGFDSLGTARFCPKCSGSAFTSDRRCGRCFGVLHPDANFCTRCGTRVVLLVAA